jgi:hypothetical protein
LLEGLSAAEDLGAKSSAVSPPSDVQLLVDAPLDAGAVDLLRIAFDASSKMPLNPHLKNRARGQEQAVLAAIELGQHALALEFAEQIGNWRRGSCLADLAMAELGRNSDAKVEWILQRAAQVAEQPAAEAVDQDWRRDRIRSKVAAAYLQLGDEERAQSFALGVSSSETSHFESVRAGQLSAEEFDQQLDAVPTLMAAASFEQARSILGNLALLHGSFYADAERRARAQAGIEENWISVPMLVRIDLVIELAIDAVEHEDSDGAKSLLDQAKALIHSFEWTPDVFIQLYARAALVRAQAGAHAQAQAELDAAMSLYDGGRVEIVDIYRAGVLRPVAEAYLAAGLLESAERTYTRALDECQMNPNSRPRALDLTANCASMALHGFAPSEAMRMRIKNQLQALSDPW